MREQACARGDSRVLDPVLGTQCRGQIVPDVTYLWVGNDFFALFVKFFLPWDSRTPCSRRWRLRVYPDWRP